MSGKEPATQIAPVESPQMVSTVKLPILKKGEYTLWSMRMEQYLTNTDYSLWQVILNGDGPIQVITDENSIETEVPPKTAQVLLARQRERKSKSILLLAIPDEYQLRFHAIKDAKTLWVAIKSRFGGNVESKNMQKNVLKQQFENFSVSDTKGQDKAYDRNKAGIDDLDIDDLYNNIKVFEADIKRGHFIRECKAPRNQGNMNRDERYRSRDNTRRIVPVETSAALVVQDNDLIVQDGMGYDWSYIAQDEPTEFALMAYTANSSGLDTEIAVLEFEVKGKSNAITRLKNQLDETLREKDYLKAKLEQIWRYSSGSELFNSVFDSRSSDRDDNQTNDRFKKDNGYHVVPPTLTGNYMPSLADLSFAGLDDSVYRPTTNKTSASVSQVEASTSQTSNTSVEIPNGVIIKDWVSDDEDIFQSNDLQATDKPSFKKVEFSDARNESIKPKQAKKPRMITQNPKVDRRDWNGQMTQKPGLGFGFTKKACFERILVKGKLDQFGIHKSERIQLVLPSILNTRVSKEKVNTVRVNGVNTAGQTTVSTVKGNGVTAVKASTDIDGGFVAFGGNTRGGKITGIGKIRTNKIDFEDVFFVKELKFNLFSVSQMCDKKNSILFTETECLVLSPDFKLIDESQVLLRVPRQNNMYNFDLKNVVPSGDLTCLFAKATIDESKLWHRRLGHVNFKTMNKLVKGNLVRGLPSKTFENDHTCVACQKGKQHKASCKTKLVSSISQPLQMLHMDLFGPTSVRSINHKTYCLVVTDDFSRENSCCQNFTTKNELLERKNRTLIEAARTMLADSLLPIVFWAEAVNTACYVLNRVLVTKPHNKTPYELIIGRAPSISFMRPFGCPVTILNTLDPLGKFDGKAEEGFLVGYSVNSKAFRVFNTETRKVEENLHVNFLENKPNVAGQGPNWLFDIDSLTNSMNYQPVTAGNQTNKNAQETNGNIGLKKNVDAGQTEEENVSTQQYIVFPLWSSISSSYKSSDDKAKDYTVDDDACKKTVQEPATQCNSQEKITRASSTNSFNTVSTLVNTASASKTFSPVGPSSGPSFVPFGGSFPIDAATLPYDPLMPELEDTTKIQSTGIFGNAYDDHDLLASLLVKLASYT
ncbi:putative ribonuclease H-like domain-containing protein [Tanacetum coccineum]